MPTQPNLFLIAGEASGDFLGSTLLQELKIPSVGVGGPLMRRQGLAPIFNMEELEIMGFFDVAKNLPRLMALFRKTVAAILQMKPTIVVTIDYPGFNLRLAKTLRKKGFKGKLYHIVCPSVWAWGKKRVATLAENYDLLFTLFPFEKGLFAHTSLRVEYIGHPLVQTIAPSGTPQTPLIALFPGSRAHEIKRNLPFFLRLLPKLPHYFVAISLAHEKFRPLIEAMAGPIPLLLPDAMKTKTPTIAIAKCGTIALELALRGIPTVVTYGMSTLDTLLAQRLFRINLPHYSLPNLILNRPLFPELIGPALTDERLFQATSSLLSNLAACQQGCQEVRAALAPGASFAPFFSFED